MTNAAMEPSLLYPFGFSDSYSRNESLLYSWELDASPLQGMAAQTHHYENCRNQLAFSPNGPKASRPQDQR